ncbi:carboxylating nicotinate-nucleotide diphosphorylase [Porphyromonas levii]|uniref:carboxylating nicotinate-nucleotide diphosphorylase n=1 Tax=Porphyromonas levii TaxID=28114 RepID=UPI000364E705|nr:carboxylating nicotinate-nucleotide diphosphorylase [Porphyromonas levii]MBR8703412.1 Nicotinate-nucleotide pyrophosphorylase [carboxylating] [Porphyromonas levii]MBR8712616.1 Nicotinate-nucleotide pyrophosphorylase [carboxylating] [Porphyromonas levii]MBR8714608.1 Nicotinate-nucleotide pyrophosphorylase [carboxylating] [Porphyromonas levii]MBR8727111.1 Nicotinate-nucleotide pyrophosphorylase [carboxylating] [Porphyromonas levii]MBR8730014.1 Nicotinate-nucleotide pyrophosphorylase [carboxyl
MENNILKEDLLDRLIEIAIEEDVASGDLATDAIIGKEGISQAIITAKADGIISGIEIARKVFARMARSEYSFEAYIKDGDAVKRGDKILEIKARYNDLLTAERLMLNFLQRMSGIATATHLLVSLIEGTKAVVLDTRKTAPGHRVTDKLAVRHGGGSNHRMGLYDMAMIKDNHIKTAGSISRAIEQVKAVTPLSVKVEVETTNLNEVEEALAGGADIIMLDNMTIETMKEAVALIAGRAKTEASGNITLERIREVAETGVDYISVGALTHSVKALDMSMNFKI